MEIDLPRLYHTVQDLGGLKEVKYILIYQLSLGYVIVIAKNVKLSKSEWTDVCVVCMCGHKLLGPRTK